MNAMFRKAMMLSAAWVVLMASAAAEVVEEETWYNADGQVVKSVKRTLTAADAQPEDDWEPAWVVRERERGTPTVRYSPGYSRSYGYQPYWGVGSYYFSSRRSCHAFRGRTSGFTGYFRGGGGGARWGVSYRSPGVSIRYRR